MDLDFLKDLFGKAITVLKTGWGVLSSEFAFAKYLYTYGKYFVGMAKELSGKNEE